MRGLRELPRLLRQEAAEQLGQPGEFARMQAERHRQEAQRLLGEQVAQLLEADRMLYADQLRQARDRAGADLTAGIAWRDQADAALEEPRGTETRAAGERDDAEAARRDFELELKKCERYRKGTKAIVHARQALALADEELAGKNAALAVAQGARRLAEDAFAAADAEVRRLTAVRDSAVARMFGPGPSGLSADSLNELAAPLVSLAKDLFDLRMSRPEHRFTQADVLGGGPVAAGIGIATTLARLTGVSLIEFAQGADAGHAQARAEQDTRPGLRKGKTVNDMTVMSPASLPQAATQPGGPSLALSQANPLRGSDATAYRYPLR